MLDPRRWEYVRLIDRDGHSIRNDLYHKPEETASYIIWKEGDKIYAKDGHTGQIPFSGKDAATVIQSALNALASGRTWKEMIYLKGSFTISSSISIPSYTRIVIDGVLKAGTGITDAILKTSDNTTEVEVIGGVIDGDGQSIRGIDFVTVGLSNITLRDLSVINCVLDGIRLKGITNLKINNLLVDNCGQQSLQHNIYPMRIYNGNFSNIITINSPAGAGLKMRGVQNVLITNLVSKSNQDGLVIAGGDSSEDTTENVIVDGFSFVGNSRYGFHTYDEKATSRWITLANGVIRESGQDGIALHASGTRWIDISNVIVMNSGIETPNTYNGVDISEGRWITITGCIIADLNYAVADRTQKDGIYISSDAKDIIVTGNLFTRNRGYGVNNESTRVRIYNNYYYENNLGDIVGGSVNKGTATIPNGSSSVVVNHGLHSAPSVVKLTGTHSEVKDCWVTNVTDTQFTINAPAAVSADRDIYWQAEV